MSRIKINYFGRPFDSASEADMFHYNGRISSIFEFVSDFSGDFDIFTHDTLVPGGINNPQHINHQYTRALWIQEPRPLQIELFKLIETYFEKFMSAYKFDYIFTLDKELSRNDPRIIFLEGNGSFIQTPGIYKKTKLCSMISSDKQFTDAQKVRVSYANMLKDSLDLFGIGFNPIDCKSEALNEYMFSVAIENTFSEATFTEKILDCFLTGVVPVYLGANDLTSIFDCNGIIPLNSSFNINKLTPSLYKKLFPHVVNNYIIALELLCPIEKALALIYPLPTHLQNRLKINQFISCKSSNAENSL